MIEKIDDNRINELTEAIVLGYLKMNNQNPRKILCVDLDGIAKEYFGFDVLYESIAEDDPDIVAFSANGIKPLRIKRNGSIEDVVFSEKTIVLDTYFKQPQNSIQRRLTLSHELGHKIYEKIAPGHDVGNYKKIFDAERDYTIEELKEQLKVTESQATQVGCALQMPYFLLHNTLRRVMRKDRFTVYGDHQILPDDSPKFKRMADDMGVSCNMLFIQLRKHRLIDYNPIEKYMKLVGLEGVQCL